MRYRFTKLIVSKTHFLSFCWKMIKNHNYDILEMSVDDYLHVPYVTHPDIFPLELEGAKLPL